MFILNFKVVKLINVGVIYLNEKGSIIDNLSSLMLLFLLGLPFLIIKKYY